MKWLQANPVGVTLAGIGGFLVLVALVMAIVWTLPVSVEEDERAGADTAGVDKVVVAEKLEPLAKYEVINQKPVFNETRLPVITDDGELLEEGDDVDPEIAIAGAPDVKLTGIIIAPGMKLASLTPNDATIQSVMAYEGDALTGEFQGWQISKVDPRKVMLESMDGQTLQLELEVHDAKIQQPIKPATPPKEVASSNNEKDSPQRQPSADAGEDEEEPLSRAEQIRQRIAERREELRREQEQMDEANKRSRTPVATNAYQNAIRARINSQRKDNNSDDNGNR